MTTPILIFISGQSCAGKSTLIKEFQKILPRLYHIGYDKVKWWLSVYNRLQDRDIVQSLLSWFIEVILDRGVNCISDAYFTHPDQYRSLQEKANSKSYRILSIHLECDEATLLTRFHERIERARIEWMQRISVTEDSVFLENMKKPYYIPEESVIFDTSNQSLEWIVNQTLPLISSHQ